MEVVAKLKNFSIAPRKVRLVADMIRNMHVIHAMHVLQYEPKHCATALLKLLRSAIANWQNQYIETKIEDADLYIKEIKVDGARMLKRFKPAPQGRSHRIRKRSNHVTLVIAAHNKKDKQILEKTEHHDKNNT